MRKGLFLLDQSGAIRGANETALEMIDGLPGLFSGPKQVDLLVLKRMVEQGPGESSGLVHVSVDVLANGSAQTSHLLVTVQAKWAFAERRRRILVEQFRMTPAELRLAELLMDGLTPKMAAEKLEITIHTVRTYLKRLYAKAGVKNQAGLVRALIKAEGG